MNIHIESISMIDDHTFLRVGDNYLRRQFWFGEEHGDQRAKTHGNEMKETRYCGSRLAQLAFNNSKWYSGQSGPEHLPVDS